MAFQGIGCRPVLQSVLAAQHETNAQLWTVLQVMSVVVVKPTVGLHDFRQPFNGAGRL